MKNLRTYQLAKELYQQGQKQGFKGELGNQFERASLSVVLNISEGAGKVGKDRKRFFMIAMGSLREVQACLDITGSPLATLADQIGGCLHRLNQNPGPGI
jgi:four helix bundle protein